MHGVLQTVRCLGDAVDLEDEGQNIACVCDIADQLLTFTARELAIGDGQESQRAREVSISIPSKILLVDKKNTVNVSSFLLSLSFACTCGRTNTRTHTRIRFGTL